MGHVKKIMKKEYRSARKIREQTEYFTSGTVWYEIILVVLHAADFEKKRTKRFKNNGEKDYKRILSLVKIENGKMAEKTSWS